MSHKLADRSFKCLLGIMVALLVVCHLSSPVLAKEPPVRSAVYPPAGDRELINNLQAALFDNGCYGNRLVRDGPDGEVDGQFERKSRKAIWVFIDTINDTVAGAQKFKATDLTARAILSAFSLPVVKNTPQFCREFGEDFLSLYFTDANEHLPNGAGSVPVSGACKKDDVSQNYLRSKGNEFASFTRAFDLVRKQFGTIYAGTIDFQRGWADTTKQAFAEHSIPVVDKASAERALKIAFEQWQRLSFAYGLTKKDCLTCYEINDWIYLRNIGQSNGGHLVSAKPNPTGGTTNLFRFKVDTITKGMLKSVVPLIKLHRGVTANFNRHYDWLLDPTKIPAGLTAPEIQARTLKLTQVRADALHDIILRLNAPPDGSAKPTPQNPLMSSLAESYRCDGFDGRSVDQ